MASRPLQPFLIGVAADTMLRRSLVVYATSASTPTAAAAAAAPSLVLLDGLAKPELRHTVCHVARNLCWDIFLLSQGKTTQSSKPVWTFSSGVKGSVEARDFASSTSGVYGLKGILVFVFVPAPFLW